MPDLFLPRTEDEADGEVRHTLNPKLVFGSILFFGIFTLGYGMMKIWSDIRAPGLAQDRARQSAENLAALNVPAVPTEAQMPARPELPHRERGSRAACGRVVFRSEPRCRSRRRTVSSAGFGEPHAAAGARSPPADRRGDQRTAGSDRRRYSHADVSGDAFAAATTAAVMAKSK